MGYKLITIIAICVLLISGYFTFLYKPQSESECNLGALYLKPSELTYASKIADKINGVVVIPELNQLIANSNILDCDNFDYTDYIKGDKK